jgi:hypothetical protein
MAWLGGSGVEPRSNRRQGFVDGEACCNAGVGECITDDGLVDDAGSYQGAEFEGGSVEGGVALSFGGGADGCRLAF